jgi:catechol 2,3-dioxygenase
MGIDPAAPRDPEELTAAGRPVAREIPAATRPGRVHLLVGDLERSLAFYTRTIGLTIFDAGLRSEFASGPAARLGVGERELLVLHEQAGIEPAHGYCGLYHFALLVPERADLARWLAHAARERVALTGFSDHYVSEAIYLNDPDGHGIEIYWDRPRPHWEGQVAGRMTTLPLDMQSLLGELADPAREPFAGIAVGTAVGHVHLRVADIAATVAFYRDLLGLGLMAAVGGQAAFLSAGGYHHHVGVNTWESAGAGQPPEDAPRLLRAELVLPTAAERDRLAERLPASGREPHEDGDSVLALDPSGNPIALTHATPATDS